MPQAAIATAAQDDAADETLDDLVELLFFAYRDFVGDPDRILAVYGFGRAHHRVLHFVSRRPGMAVTDLLDVLRITKQSLNRVLKDLIEGGFVAQRPGTADRRRRLLHVTAAGEDLAERLAQVQGRRIAQALTVTAGTVGPSVIKAAASRFLRAMIDGEASAPSRPGAAARHGAPMPVRSPR